MRRSPWMAMIALIVALLSDAPPAVALDAMRYIYHPPESPTDKRLEYRLEILKAALERTRAAYGPYVLEPATPMSQERQAYEMQNATGRLTVMHRTSTPEFERNLIPVRIPLDKGLIGYRVFLIRRQDQPKFDAVRTPDDLRRFTYGLGLGWPDVDILKRSGLRVITGDDYDGLFDMLINRRFDAFPRGTVEVLEEFDQRRDGMPDLAIEKSLLLHYPLPIYFWFPKTAEGERLAARTRDGMLAMIEDGTYDRIFSAHYGRKVEQLNLKHRRTFRIANPLLSSETPLEDKRLWFDPIQDDLPSPDATPAEDGVTEARPPH